ncbi:Rhodanese-like domain protein [Pseudodesulfovibrio hydrargyri]|uniref:Rhodanese-like domain protein n=2 Tax=Pseudodesulfovibrio hydrargyri TaxID=2125990 RepID=A0A1J5N631_9BACT|nr:Rhodanese-like domain protein [Pseudodesulfovibrio hydrargyri]
MPGIITCVAWLLLAFCVLGARPVRADGNEVWWASAEAEAKRDDYRLIDDNGLRTLVGSGADMVLLDARADYEYGAGHIPGAANLEFDLGDDLDLSREKREALAGLMGPDRDRLLVIYCRSFR